MNTMTPPKAYSYLRFSTPEQERGDSHRRQTEAAVKYAAAHGLDLDEALTFQDRGVSGFRGANAASGKLREFIRAVEDGVIEEGSYLLVENLDRISRQNPWDAMPLFQSLINLGITIVTLQDGKTWSKELLQDNPYRIMESIIVMIRANEESETKSRRLKSVWSSKRATAHSKVLTSMAPSWLALRTDRSGFDVDEKKATIVRRIFEMARDGMGGHRIARTLNLEGVRPLGRGKMWRRSNIVKLLSYEGVIGTFVPHTIETRGDYKRYRKAQTKVEGYYPSIVSDQLWSDVQALMGNSGVSPLRGRHAKLTNVLSGIATCSRCRGPMTKVNKGNGYEYLVCSRAKVGAGCTYMTSIYGAIDYAVRTKLIEQITEVPAGLDEHEIDHDISQAEAEVDEIRETLFDLVEEIGRKSAPVLVAALRAGEQNLEAGESKLVALKNRRDRLANRYVVERVKALRLALADDSSTQVVNTLLRLVFESAEVDRETGFITLNWHHSQESLLLPYAWPRSS